MNASPKTHPYEWDGGLTVIPATGVFVLECRVTDPPSTKGRTLYLCLDQDTEERLFKLLKNRAIQRRRITMREAEGARS